MTWSSTNSGAGLGPADDDLVNARSFAWTELEAAPMAPEEEAAAKAAEAQRHLREVEAAYNRGLADGREQGVVTARGELRALTDTVRQALDSVRAQREAWAGHLEEDLVILAAAMASKIVEERIEADAEIFASLSAKAVAAFPVEEPVRVRLNPADLDDLERTGAIDSLTGDRSVRWIPDEETTRGGVIVEGPDKIIDGRVDEALRRLVRELTNA